MQNHVMLDNMDNMAMVLETAVIQWSSSKEA